MEFVLILYNGMNMWRILFISIPFDRLLNLWNR